MYCFLLLLGHENIFVFNYEINFLNAHFAEYVETCVCKI